jgi:hypothetical protein
MFTSTVCFLPFQAVGSVLATARAKGDAFRNNTIVFFISGTTSRHTVSCGIEHGHEYCTQAHEQLINLHLFLLVNLHGR